MKTVTLGKTGITVNKNGFGALPIQRITKEEERLNKEIKRAKGILANEKFVSKAPEAKVQEERDKLEKYEQMLAQVKERMVGLG